MMADNQYLKEKHEFLARNGLYECCGVPASIGEKCRFVLCPVNKESELAKAALEAAEKVREEK